MFTYYETNGVGRDFVCGDIHGCYTDLYAKLKEVGFDKKKDRLFPVGDYTDRGPESEKALEFLKEEWVCPVMGNHESIILQCYQYKTSPALWHMQNGGMWWYKTSPEFKEEYLTVIKSLPLAIQVGEYGIIHSRLPRYASWGDFVKHPSDFQEYLLWERNEFCYDITDIDKVYAGHSIHDEIVEYGNVIDIDTGAFLKYCDGEEGKLTVLELKHKEKTC